VIALRLRLGVERPAFAKIVGVDTRSVTRWEAGQVEPSGPSLAVMNAIREKLDRDPAHAEEVTRLIVGAADLGGLAYLLLKLLDGAVRPLLVLYV